MAFVIVTEMTNDHAMVIPLMAVCHDGVYPPASPRLWTDHTDAAPRAAAELKPID
jgi:hypothetical protein